MSSCTRCFHGARAVSDALLTWCLALRAFVLSQEVELALNLNSKYGVRARQSVERCSRAQHLKSKYGVAQRLIGVRVLTGTRRGS